MAESALATVNDNAAAIAEQVVIKGDLARLTEPQRMEYYTAVCRSLGLNPLTRPFEYINLNGKLTLYATRAAADQLRALRGITITSLDPRQVGELMVVVATGRDRAGREDRSTGAVSTKGLAGEALANAMMKAETKAKRRLTLSLAGLGWSDETEVESIGQRADVDMATGEIRQPASLSERVAERRRTISQDAGATGSAQASQVAAGSTPPGPAAADPIDDDPEWVPLPDEAPAWTAERLRAAATTAGRTKSAVSEALVAVADGRPTAEFTPADWAAVADRLGLA